MLPPVTVLLIFILLLQQLTGSTAATVSAAQVSDPYGIRIAFSAGHPLALLTWKQYMSIIVRMSKTVEQQLQGPALEAVAAFNRERKLLVGPGAAAMPCTILCQGAADA